MRLHSLLILLLGVTFAASARTIHVTSDLQAAIDQLRSRKEIRAADVNSREWLSPLNWPDTLLIAPGRYEAIPESLKENSCGNCADPWTEVSTTWGFHLHGRDVVIRGSGPDSTILVTNAGYGLLCQATNGIVIENLTITGGKRDVDGRATDAGIVIRWGHVTVRNCVIRDNTNFVDSTVVGIGGVMVREGGRATIENCRIINNSWDGVALYHGAEAEIRNCEIDSGRGVGIGVTWDAVATCEGNTISHYWKGIGSFGTATVVARQNIVRDNLGWGIIAAGTSTMVAENNTVVRNGNCGLAIWEKGTRGRFVNNISAFNGWRKQWVCPCVGFWNQEGDTCGWTISHNLVWGNDSGNVVGADSAEFLIADPKFTDSLCTDLLVDSPAARSGSRELSAGNTNHTDIGANMSFEVERRKHPNLILEQ